MVDYTAMGRRMKARRRSKKLSQEEMALAVHISVSFYGNIERGTRVPSVDTLVAIANVLEVGLDYLLVDSVNAASIWYPAENTGTLCRFLRENVAELDYGDENDA